MDREGSIFIRYKSLSGAEINILIKNSKILCQSEAWQTFNGSYKGVIKREAVYKCTKG